MTTEDHLEEHPASRKVDLAIWRRLYRYAARYPRLISGVALFGMLTAAIEITFPLITAALVDEVADRGMDARITRWAAAYVGLAVLLGLSVTVFVRLTGGLRAHVAHDIRAEAFGNMERLSLSFFDSRPVGWLMSRMTSDCDRLSIILAWGTLDCVWGAFLMIGGSAAMLWLEWRLALAVIAIVPVLAAVSMLFQRRLLATAREVRRSNSKLTAAYNEGLAGALTTRLFGRVRRGKREFDHLSGDMYAHSTQSARLSASYAPLVVSLASLALGLALVLGGVRVAEGTLSVGVLVGFLAFARVFFEPVRELSAWFAEMQMAQAAAERVLGLIAEVPDIADSAEVVERCARMRATDAGGPDQAIDGGPLAAGTLRLEDVSFAYGTGPNVLSNFDLEIRPGETIALVGPTGGGKSTLVSLLARFYDPTEGRITASGIDLRDRSLEWLRSRLALVQQTPHLFSGTVAENLRFAAPQATDAEVQEAARRVGLHPLVAARPAGYGTEVGEVGGHLSAGERQLTSFARALLADPEVLILDEATSSIDPETEHRLQAGVEAILAERTCIIVAHRLSTIRGADRILVIEGGRIVEQGSHTELLAAGGRYRELYLRQSLDETLHSKEGWEEAGARRA